jgi:protein transport protein SEC61 subunit gamma-like protein
MKIKETLQNYKRVLQVTKKPSKSEFTDTLRICTIGIAVIGIIGFVLYLLTLVIGI